MAGLSQSPSYKRHVLAPLAQLLGSMKRQDKQQAFFVGTPQVGAFRKGVLEVVSEAWWKAKLGQAKDRPHAEAIRVRLEHDHDEVGAAWLERRGVNNTWPASLTVFCETVLGTAVYNAVVNFGFGDDEDRTMRTFGKIYGALLQSIALPNHIVEAPAGFAFINGEPISTYKKYLLLPIEAIFNDLEHSQHPHAFAPTDLAHAFCSGFRTAFPEHSWDVLGLAATYAIRERLQADHAKVAALPAHQLTDKVLFTLLLGASVCEAFPPTSEENVVELGKAYGALLKSLTVPGHTIEAPGGFSYRAGQPMSISHQLAHRQPAAARSSAFFPLSRGWSGTRW